MNTTRRGFLTALLASPLLAKLELSRIVPQEFSLADFTAQCMKAKNGDLFLVSESLFSKLWNAMGDDDKFLDVGVASHGFHHILFHGKPVIYYPDGEREEWVQIISQSIKGDDGRLNISEIKV